MFHPRGECACAKASLKKSPFARPQALKERPSAPVRQQIDHARKLIKNVKSRQHVSDLLNAAPAALCREFSQ